MLFSIEKETTSLKKATFINIISKYSVVLLSLLFNSILARILAPQDYGVVAVVTVFTNFFSLFCDMGIGTAVIQNKQLSIKDEERIFAFTIILGAILFLIFLLVSGILVELYDNKIYYTIGPLLGVSLAFSAFNMVPNALLMKSKKFLLVGIRTILASVVGYIIAIIIALLGGKSYSIVFQSIFSAVFIFVWNIISTKLRVNFYNIKNSMKKIWNFSSYQFAFSFVNYFSRNLDNLLTGYYFGDVALGYYDKAYRLMRYPVDALTNVITPSLQPILSDYQDDTKYVLDKYNKLIKMLALIAVYVSCLCYFASREIILLFFGSQWEGSVLCFKFLAVSLFFQIVGGVSGSIYQILNKTKEMFWAGIVGTIITVIAIIVGVYVGSIEALALSYSIGFILNFIKSQWFLSRFCFKESFFSLTKVFVPEAMIAIVICFVMSYIPALDNWILSFFLKFCVCTIIYILMLVITKEYKLLLMLIPQKIKNKFLKVEK